MASSAHSEPTAGLDPVVRILRRSPGRLRLALSAAHSDPVEIERAIQAAPGVETASLGRRTGNLLVTYDTRRSEGQAVLAAIVDTVCRLTQTQAATPASDSTSPREWAVVAAREGEEERGSDAREGEGERAVVAARDLEPANGWMGAEGSCLIRATPADCARTILDFAAYPAWQRYVTRVELLERDAQGRGSVVRTEGRVGERTVAHVMRYRYPSATRVCWEQLEGELEAIRGEWRFRSAARAGTRASCRIEVRPGLRLRLLLRGPLYEQVRDTLISHTLQELRSRVEDAQSTPRS